MRFSSYLAAAGLILASGTTCADHIQYGGIICPTPYVIDEALLAVSRGDTPWFRSTGCLQVLDRPVAIVIRQLPGPQYDWQVRVPTLNLTGYVPTSELMVWQDSKEIKK